MSTYYDELIVTGVPDEVPAQGFTFEDVFDEHVAGSQKVWSHDRALTVGASECFGCIRSTFFKKRGKELGFAPDPFYEESWGAMRRGDLIENYHIVPAVRAGLRRRGMDLIMEGDDQETIVDGRSSATLDGLIIPVDPSLNGKIPKDFLAYYGIPEVNVDSIVLEMKSMDPRPFERLTKEKSVHHGQTQMQLGLVRETTHYRPEHAIVLYFNASWLDDMRVFVVHRDEDTYAFGRARNEKVYAEDNPATYPAEGKLDGSCAYCKFTQACAKVNKERVPEKRKALNAKEIAEQDEDMLEQMDELVLERNAVKEEEKEIAKRIEDLNEDIRQLLINNDQSRAVGKGWKVFYSYQGGAKRLSATKLQEAGLNPDDFKEEGAGFEKLTVTTSKE